ncbi:Hypothetical protein DHA2_152439 [Giardia duodenalis]|uniref:Uncharacterized protein n=1 Tax=Giardia intestinalis TaxID=5741 RepID=V6TIX0_GIAIN|nr:Hypothetical protein DHA2_152439 [Giardia intestinalis]
MHPTKFQINWVAMDILHDVLAQYNDFIDKTNTANIESGISFHCLTMGGLFGVVHRIYDVLHNEGPGALLSELTSMVFGSNSVDKSDTCMQRIIKADIKKVLSTSAASAISSLSIFHIFSPVELVRSLTYQFSVEFLKMLALKNTLFSYGRRLTPPEAFVTGSIAGFLTSFLFSKSKREWLRGALRGGFKEIFAEFITRVVAYLMIEGISHVIRQQVPAVNSLNLKIIRN